MIERILNSGKRTPPTTSQPRNGVVEDTQVLSKLLNRHFLRRFEDRCDKNLHKCMANMGLDCSASVITEIGN
jgi:hypothetical protein